MAREKDTSIPTGRIRRTAKVAGLAGGQTARNYATRAANLTRDEEGRRAAATKRQAEAAEQILEVLGNMKGAAMKVGQVASFIDTGAFPEEFQDRIQAKLADVRSDVVRAVTNVHGESDHQLDNAQYKDNLLEFQLNYETDIKAKTAQTESVPMFITQFSSWPRLTGDKIHDTINGQMLAAHVAAPGKIILVGAKYHLPHVAVDGVHLSNVGYEHLGEDYAKVYNHVIVQGKTWEPLRPKTVSRAGKVVTVKFFVPSPPLVIDTTRVTDPGKNGFEFAQTGGNGAVAIDSVEVAGTDTVTITLASEPTGTDQRIRYAFTGVSNANGGPTTGPRGNLRDSDATPSLHNFELFNWCIHFDEAIP